MTSVLGWINGQFLRMRWLSDLVTYLLHDLAGLDLDTRVGASMHFFIYDVIKIFVLLSVLIFSISWIQSHFPPERTRRILGRYTGFGANILGALLGTITPFCFCSSIPLFIGFTATGLPLGVTFSFLISSPLVDLASVIMLASIFSWSIALSYVVVGLLLAVLGGTLIGRAGMADQVESFVYQMPSADLEPQTMTRRDRTNFARDQVIDIVTRVWPYILIGVGIGAAIHNWLPETVITSLLGQGKWWSVPVAIAIGVPMYADIFGTLPIAEALAAKGVGIGTALSFMMAVTALSLPSLIMLKRVIKMRLLVLFTAIVTAGILLIGFLFNRIGHLFV